MACEVAQTNKDLHCFPWSPVQYFLDIRIYTSRQRDRQEHISQHAYQQLQYKYLHSNVTNAFLLSYQEKNNNQSSTDTDIPIPICRYRLEDNSNRYQFLEIDPYRYRYQYRLICILPINLYVTRVAYVPNTWDNPHNT